MPRPPYIGKACTRPNLEDLSLFSSDHCIIIMYMDEVSAFLYVHVYVYVYNYSVHCIWVSARLQ